jgi:hypothetical protein
VFIELWDTIGGKISQETDLASIHKLSVHLSESTQRTVMKNLAWTYACRRKDRKNKEQAFVIIWQENTATEFRYI